ncbi:hypothetical protein [Ensifer adhaerens]|uniref:hypothetical protein n=1 Tax=Ensifer adhaerens TaxID=106592 RepID=UPI00098EC4E9|nr:hypothetical protein [Ensifer adhaerens]
MARVPIREYAANRSEGEVRALISKYKLDVQPSTAGETVAADTLDQLFTVEGELRQLGTLRSELSATRAELNEVKPSMWHVKAATMTAAISALAACVATGLTVWSARVASDQLSSSIAATDAKNRYEVQILVANKLTETASAPADEVTNRLFDFNSAFVIANDLHEDGGFVRGWQEFIDRYCGPLKDKNFYKADDDPLADTRSICERNTQ